jgi:hypothetical protein
VPVGKQQLLWGQPQPQPQQVFLTLFSPGTSLGQEAH